MTAPAVSVLMTAYNREPYIASAIESVLAQRFTDFELVIVDDCSTDATRAVAERYARADARIRLFSNQQNVGDYANRNRAAEYARAPLLKYHDSDDILYPYALDVMVTAMRAAPQAAVGLSHSKTWPGGPCPMVLSPRLAYAREFLGHGVFQCGPGGSIIRTGAFRSVGGFRDLGVCSDYAMWLRLAREFPIVLVPADLVWYREHRQQELRRPQAAYAYARLNQHVWRALRADECPLHGDELERARTNQAGNVVKQTWRDIKRWQWSLAVYRVAHAGLSTADWIRYLRRPRRDPLAGTPTCADGTFEIPEWVRASTHSMPT